MKNNIPKITHNIYETKTSYKHSLSIDGEESRPVGYKDIARNGIYCAVTKHYKDYFPEVFIVTSFTKVSNTVSKIAAAKNITQLVKKSS